MKRRLAAVLAADVAGYSRLMGGDEEDTLARLKAVRKALVDPAIASYCGRIVKTTGDGMLVEFASAVDAVRGAVDVQRRMARAECVCAARPRIEFRIGVHVGDIIIDDNESSAMASTSPRALKGLPIPAAICTSGAHTIRFAINCHSLSSILAIRR